MRGVGRTIHLLDGAVRLVLAMRVPITHVLARGVGRKWPKKDTAAL